MNLTLINELSADAALATFLKCCGCNRWAQEMTNGRPYASCEELSFQAELSFAALRRSEWLEAFAAHPKIGDLQSLREKYSQTKDWAQSEQSGVNGSSEKVIADLSSGNQAYEEKFGYIFIVCATGKTASEMLSLLEQRLHNTPERELSIAAGEQKKITQLRLEKI